MSLRFLLLFFAFSVLGLSASFAKEEFWVGLYLAEDAPPPGAVLASEKLTRRLHAVFGFKHYELLKAQGIELAEEWEQWFVPRRDFFIRVEPLPRQPGQPRCVDYEIYKDGFIVAKGKYEPKRETPLFINGPDFNEGRLVLVLKAPPEPRP